MISIIVPIYNAGTTLERCLNSLQNQTYTDIEVIMIDDGSKDNSSEICIKFQKLDRRFKYIYQENSGVSVARNVGLDVALGDYIGFCDADDWVDSDMYEFLYYLSVSNNADISICSFYTDTINSFQEKVQDEEIFTYTAKEAIMEMHIGKKFAGQLWNKLFRKHCIKNKRFLTDITIYEDMLFLWGIFQYSNCVVFQNVRKYHYLQLPTSAMHIFKDSFWSVQKACDLMLDMMQTYYPDMICFAQKTVLLGNIELARRLSEARKLTYLNYKLVKEKIDKNFSQNSFQMLPKSYKRSVFCFRKGRTIFNLYIKLLKLKHIVIR